MCAVSAANHRIPFVFQRIGMASQDTMSMSYDAASGPCAIVDLECPPKPPVLKTFLHGSAVGRVKPLRSRAWWEVFRPSGACP